MSEKREYYPFARRDRDCFEGLEAYKNGTRFDLHNSQIELEYVTPQGDLFADLASESFESETGVSIYSDRGLKTRIGDVYESMVHGFYGGFTHRKITPPEIPNGFPIPDVVDYQTQNAHEVKASETGSSIKVCGFQLLSYLEHLWLQEKKYVEHRFNFKYELFRHGVGGAIKQHRVDTTQAFASEFAVQTRAHISLPLSLMFRVITHPLGRIYRLSDREDHYAGISILNASVVNALLSDPKKTLENTFEINPQRYEIQKGYVEGLCISDCAVKPFPSLRITERNPDNFRREVVRELEALVELNDESFKDKRSNLQEYSKRPLFPLFKIRDFDLLALKREDLKVRKKQFEVPF